MEDEFYIVDVLGKRTNLEVRALNIKAAKDNAIRLNDWIADAVGVCDSKQNLLMIYANDQWWEPAGDNYD